MQNQSPRPEDVRFRLDDRTKEARLNSVKNRLQAATPATAKPPSNGSWNVYFIVLPALILVLIAVIFL